MSLTPIDPQHKYSAPNETHVLYRLLQDCGPQSLGLYGECLAHLWLNKSGYAVRSSHGCDLIATNPRTGKCTRIEVKTARRAVDGRFHFTLIKDNHTDHRDSDVVVLLCVDYRWRVVPFVIPVAVLADQRQVTVSLDPILYTGKFSSYRQSPESLYL
jgi:hypothetical protein